MNNTTEAGIQIIKEAIEDIQKITRERIVRGVQITVIEGKLQICLPGHGWYTFPETKDRYTLQCDRCKCFNVKIGLNTDICVTCQHELNFEEAERNKHEQWLQDQDNRQDEEAADSECYSLPDGTCIAPLCKLHGVRYL